MTDIEEFIEEIEDEKTRWSVGCTPYLTLDKAIQAIRELCDKSDELEEENFRLGDTVDELNITLTDAFEKIRKLQEQIPKWHLCSEKLPTEYGYYLCQLKGTRNYGGNIQVCKFRQADKFVEHNYFDHMRDGFPKVIAWMELPKFEEG